MRKTYIKNRKSHFLPILFFLLFVAITLISVVAIFLPQDWRRQAKDEPQNNGKIDGEFAYRIPLVSDANKSDIFISRLTVGGRVQLNDPSSFLRLILVSKDKHEFLIYEANASFDDVSTVAFSNACEETCYLETIKPDYIRVEGANSKLFLDNTNLVYSSKSLTPAMISEGKLAKQKQDIKRIDLLKNKLSAKKITWQAGETEVSKLSYENKKKLLRRKDGLTELGLPNLQGFEYYKGGVFRVATSKPSMMPTTTNTPLLPTSWDWRNRHGRNYVTPIKNQLSCGSCWAFAAIGTTETQINLSYNQLLNIDLSEQDSVCRHPQSCVYGGFSEDTFNELKTSGLVTESCFPYTGNESCTGKCAPNMATIWKISDYINTSSSFTDERIKQLLITKGPTTFAISTWWHIMGAVGYRIDQATGDTVWIFKNSWGTSWGQNGFGEVIVPISNRHSIYVPIEPTTLGNHAQPIVKCEDRDNDRYCNWGIRTEKPSNCPATCVAQPDCDDSNPTLGTFDASYNCQNITNLEIEPKISRFPVNCDRNACQVSCSKRNNCGMCSATGCVCQPCEMAEP